MYPFIKLDKLKKSVFWNYNNSIKVEKKNANHPFKGTAAYNSLRIEVNLFIRPKNNSRSYKVPFRTLDVEGFCILPTGKSVLDIVQ